MKRSIETRTIQAGTNEIQIVTIPKGATLVGVEYGNNDGTINVSFEGGDNNATEFKRLQVYDSRMNIPGEYHPLTHSVSDKGIVLYVVEPTTRTAFNNAVMEQALVSFGNYLLHKYSSKLTVVSDPKQKAPAVVTDADLANWRHSIEHAADEAPAEGATV